MLAVMCVYHRQFGRCFVPCVVVLCGRRAPADISDTDTLSLCLCGLVCVCAVLQEDASQGQAEMMPMSDGLEAADTDTQSDGWDEQTDEDPWWGYLSDTHTDSDICSEGGRDLGETETHSEKQTDKGLGDMVGVEGIGGGLGQGNMGDQHMDHDKRDNNTRVKGTTVGGMDSVAGIGGDTNTAQKARQGVYEAADVEMHVDVSPGKRSNSMHTCSTASTLHAMHPGTKRRNTLLTSGVRGNLERRKSMPRSVIACVCVCVCVYVCATQP